MGAAKIVRDVTAEKAARRESEKTRELLLGTLGHDLRNPLNTINVSVHTLKRDAADADQKVLARISNSATRMSRMIDQLLDFTRSRLGGGIPIQPQTPISPRSAERSRTSSRPFIPGGSSSRRREI